MAAVGRRMQVNGHRNGATASDHESHELDDMDAGLLQTFIVKRVLTLDDAHRILGMLLDATGSPLQVSTLTIDSEIDADQDSFEEAVSRLNTAISDFDLEIRKTLSQSNGSPLWAIV